ncbi:NifU N-terminal domain-containing protein [Staphylococcus pasteuri]|uniref:NifU N-terminal domain-containing protein n=1 Tax=Staphylococcus TaxID=1279 RepID=UPI0002EF4EC5|nr:MULTISPECIES: NifU N-terminal domain-containing protein [Staphylococcus]ODB40279.1 scaffolding protein [Staphylococcus sp. AOAB]RQX29052.1 scaffolding protein [Staphylococcus warneri]MBL3397808.1 NifU N-terminal domain-containing protein [Staphylococcus pasteuri]MBM6507333.1 NifU N-terminal domain-containing protein [Staphylococcus pasteuri]MCD9067190.1 NifU N-terminal domain-containing protein [Staphylococcus pasteuri]
MEIVSISETPNHNTMKITLNESREDMKSNTYTEAQEGQPEFINALFDIDGVKSIFYVMDFISVDKEDQADWNTLIPQIEDKFNQ